MKAVILAGGVSVGRPPLKNNSPRALLPVANRPLVKHTLALLAASGFTEAIICGSGETQDFQNELGGGCDGMRLIYRSSSAPCGPAGCLRLARDYLDDERFLAVEGSALIDFDPAAFVTSRPEAAVLVGVVSDETPQPSWSKSTPCLRPAGAYSFDTCVLDEIGTAGYLDIKQQLLPKLTSAGKNVLIEEIDGCHCFVRDVGALLSANYRMLMGQFTRMFDSSGLHELTPEIWAEGDTAIAPDVSLTGPVLLGEGAEVGSGSTLIGPVAVGPGCVICEDCFVRETVLLGDNEIEPGARVSCCILDVQANVSAGGTAEDALIQSR